MNKIDLEPQRLYADADIHISGFLVIHLVDGLKPNLTVNTGLTPPNSNHVEAVKRGPVFFLQRVLGSVCAVCVTHRTTCRAACVWTAVRSVYGQPKSKNGNILQALLL